MKKIIKKFKNTKEELAYWSKINLMDELKPADFSTVSFPNLKPTSSPISIRLPAHLLLRVKEQANELDMPYQSLIKQYIAEGVA
jgi:predicted DNA binding CopG/RHH family protein